MNNLKGSLNARSHHKYDTLGSRVGDRISNLDKFENKMILLYSHWDFGTMKEEEMKKKILK